MTFLYVSGFLGSFLKVAFFTCFLTAFFKRIFYQVILDDSKK